MDAEARREGGLRQERARKRRVTLHSCSPAKGAREPPPAEGRSSLPKALLFCPRPRSPPLRPRNRKVRELTVYVVL